MAYIESYKITKYSTASTSTAGVWPDHVSGDLLVAVFSMKNSTEDFGTPTGMTAVGTGIGGNNIAIKAFWISATSSSMTDPNSTGHTSTTYRACATFVIKDAPTTSPIDTPYATGFGASPFNTIPSQTGSTTSNNVLLLHFAAEDLWNHMQNEPGPMRLFNEFVVDGQFAIAANWDFKETAGSIDSFDWWLTRNANLGASMVIPIKSNAGIVPPRGEFGNPCCTVIQPSTDRSGYFGYSDFFPNTDIATITPATGDTSSITTHSASLGSSAGNSLNPFHYNDELVVQTAGEMGHAGYRFSGHGPYDITGKKVAFTWIVTSGLFATRTAPLENHGVIVGFESGTTTKEYAIYDAGGLGTRPNELTTTVVDENSTKMDEVNTFDVTDVRGVYYGQYAFTNQSNTRMALDQVSILEEIAIIGGDSTLPASWDVAKDIAESANLNTVSQLGSSYETSQDIWIGGTGVDDVYFETNGNVLSTPPAASISDLNVNFQAEKVSVRIKVTAGSTVKINDPLTFGKLTDFTIDSGTATGATYDFNGATISNVNFSCDVDIGQITGLTLVNFKTLSNDSADLSGGCTLNTTLDTNAVTINGATQVALQALLDQYANCGIQNSNTGIRVEYTGATNLQLTFDAIDWSDCVTDIHFNATNAVSLTAVMDNGSNASTTAISGSATGVTISAPTNDLTVNSDQSGSQIHVYTTNTQTTLDTEASATQLVYTHSNETVDITVLKDGFIPFRQTALTLSGDVTVNAQLVESREYDSSHGLTYTTDASIYDNASVITGITQANPAVVTYSGADLWSNNDIVSIHDVVGMTEVNGKRYTVANVDTGANTFELLGINSTGYTAYGSAGIVVSGLSVPSFGPAARGVFSLLLEQFRTNSSLYNRPFNLEMDGDGSLYLIDGVEGEADADIQNMTAAGVGYLDVDGTQVATWIGVESVGTIPGSNTGEWTADDATTVNDARATGVFDEIIKLHGDTDHGNFDNRANRVVMKMNINGYREERIDVRALYGVSGNFKPNHYVVPIAPVAIGAATGDPSLTTAPTITDHGATPVTWNSKDFSITITDGATPNSGEGLIRHLNYFLRGDNDTTFNGNDPFAWPEMVIEVVAGTSYETLRGYTEDAQTSTLKGVRVVQNDGTTPHPDFVRFQADDGTYYVPPVTSQISISGMPTTGANIRLQVHNVTAKTASSWAATTVYALSDKRLRTAGLGSENTAGLYFVCTTPGTSGGSEPTWNTTVGGTTNDGTVVWLTCAILFYDQDPSSAAINETYTEGEEFIGGDTYCVRFAEMDGATSFKTFEVEGVASTTGFSVVVNEVADSVYATNAVDGSSTAVTNKFTADYLNDEIDLDTNSDFAVTEAFAYYCYELTTTQGMYEFWGAVTAIDEGNYRNNTAKASLYFDETAGFVKQTDSARWFRDDDTRPVIDPTTGGSGLEINWRNPVYAYDGGGGGFTSGDRSTLEARASQVSVDALDTNVDAILVDTGTTIPAQISALNDLSAAQVNAEVDAALTDYDAPTKAELDAVETKVDGVKAKTDQLTFTKANEVDSNIQSVNDVTVTGTGASGDEWGP